MNAGAQLGNFEGGGGPGIDKRKDNIIHCLRPSVKFVASLFRAMA